MNEIEKLAKEIADKYFSGEQFMAYSVFNEIGKDDFRRLASHILGRERALVDRAEKAEVERDTWINSMSAYGATELKKEFDKLTLELSEARKALEETSNERARLRNSLEAYKRICYAVTDLKTAVQNGEDIIVPRNLTVLLDKLLKMEEALKWYADDKTYLPTFALNSIQPAPIEFQKGKLAKIALSDDPLPTNPQALAASDQAGKENHGK